MTNSVIKLEGVNKIYDNGIRTQVLFDINLEIKQGEFVALIGTSGSGKSTLLNIVGLLDTPTSGNVIIDNRNAAHLNEDERASLRSLHLGFVFQSHYLLPEFTVLENVFMPCRLQGDIFNSPSYNRVQNLLEAVGLNGHEKKYPFQLSGGQQQRAAIVRALANQPKLILADEPTGNLDSQTRDQVFQLMRKLSRENQQAFLMVTHDASLATEADRVITIRDGRLHI